MAGWNKVPRSSKSGRRGGDRQRVRATRPPVLRTSSALLDAPAGIPSGRRSRQAPRGGGDNDMIELTVNGKAYSIDVEPDTPLLWVIREQIGLTGTKYGCGIGRCGACTVHVDGVATRSCSLPVSDAAGKKIVTIEGLAQDGKLSKVQQAWIAHDVPQCGYCQCGMVMA